MSNETKLKKDIVFKDYFGDPVIFADFLNGSLYDGNYHDYFTRYAPSIHSLSTTL